MKAFVNDILNPFPVRDTVCLPNNNESDTIKPRCTKITQIFLKSVEEGLLQYFFTTPNTVKLLSRPAKRVLIIPLCYQPEINVRTDFPLYFKSGDTLTLKCVIMNRLLRALGIRPFI